MEEGTLCSPFEPKHPARKAGGWKSIKYIIGNESFEKLASMSLIANITVYLKTQYNMGGLLLINVISIWSGSTNFAPLAGAFVSDAYLGRINTFATKTWHLNFKSSCLEERIHHPQTEFLDSTKDNCNLNCMGMGIMTLTAGVSQLRPPRCDGHSCGQPQVWQLGVLFFGLALLSVGAGGIRPCNIAFGADQFDTTTKEGKLQLASFMNWWYFSFTIALLIALTFVVYIQTNVSWVLGFAIPTSCLLFSVLIFLLGKHTYICVKPQGSVFVDIAKVVVAASKKQKQVRSSDSEPTFFDPPIKESYTAKLIRTDRFRHLDKAAIIFDPSELTNDGVPKNEWRLCSVQQVEQLKCLLEIIPIWLSGIACFIVMDQQSTFGILQGIQMNKSIGSNFNIPPAWMGITSMIALSVWILIYECLYIPYVQLLTKKESRLSTQQRISAGIISSVICMLVAGILEKKRRDLALAHHSFESPLSILYLLPQFMLSGLTEALAPVAIMEFLTTHLPESMRTVGGAIFFLGLSVASYLSSLLVNMIHSLTKLNGNTPWLGHPDLNNSRLDYYYYIIACLGILNFIHFNLFAARYIKRSKVWIKNEVQLEDSSKTG
ncbi:Proton-dependent oligopeptide transporter family [Dillenia turbinata]|uniref:Proton-dependent oligopeptide transporter family n=1 Tax=Dillenia turbinata TaxID=194707 RepID=A0AAN8V4Y1_9MAGN